MAKQTAIDYQSPEWKDDAAGGTPIEAAALNRMEGGISDACTGVDALRTKRLPTYLVTEGGDTATQDAYGEDILGPCLVLDLATRTTYYETGSDEEGHRTALTSGADIDALRDSVSRTPGAGISLTSYVSDKSGSHVTRVGTTCHMRLFLGVEQGFAANHNLMTLPEDMRPAASAFLTAEVNVSGERKVMHADATDDGRVMVAQTVSKGDSILIWGAWAVER